MRTTVSPVLTGPAPGYFDRPAGRWLPVSSAAAVSPDGSRFAYSSFEAPGQGGVHVVEVATGFDRVLAVPQGFWVVVAFTGQGIYLHQAYEGTGPGLYLLDPDTDAWKTVFTDATVAAVDGAAAWIEARNPADALPPPPTMGGAYNEIERRDLVTGATAPWFYRPGSNLWVIAVANGAPVISAFDGTAISYWFVGHESQAERMEFPFALEAFPSFSGFIGEAAGVWVGGTDGVYLWTPRTGGVLVAEAVARPAGNCA